nr:PREDICTED: uncharacterized protein LOC105662803 isoform X2 [Megachile rotundata]
MIDEVRYGIYPLLLQSILKEESAREGSVELRCTRLTKLTCLIKSQKKISQTIHESDLIITIT